MSFLTSLKRFCCSWYARWLLAAAVLAAMGWWAWANTTPIVRVEEDWELVIGEPSPTTASPQVTCLISPFGTVDYHYATFVVNHCENPDFLEGGLQLQAWNGDTLLAGKRAPTQALLATPGEIIRWTQAMEKKPEGLLYEVLNGSSTTWGSFGGNGTLKIIVAADLAEDLSGYRPEVSAAHSGVSFGGNRVQSLVLKCVRYYTAEGLLAEDNNPRVVHSLAQ